MHEVYTRARIVGDAADDEPVDDSLLKEPAEQELVEAVRAQPGPALQHRNCWWAVALAPVVATFFDDVLVMDPDERVKANGSGLRDVRRAVGRLATSRRFPSGKPREPDAGQQSGAEQECRTGGRQHVRHLALRVVAPDLGPAARRPG